MKKRLIVLFVMTAVLLTACGGPVKEDPMGVYHKITGVKPEEVVLVLDGNEISAELYFYWTAFNCSALEYQLNMYHDYGMYQEVFQEDGTLNWGTEFPTGSGTTLSQYAKTMAEDTIFFYAAIENLANTYGIVLTAEDEDAIEAERQNMEDALGGPEGFENYLTEMGLSREGLTRVMAVTNLLDGLIELAGQEDSQLYLPEADYPQYLGYTDFIFFALDEDKKQAQKDAEDDDPRVEGLCRVGTVATIKQVMNLPGDSLRVLVEGESRAMLQSINQEEPYLAGVVKLAEQAAEDTVELQALAPVAQDYFETYARTSLRVSQ